MSMAGGQAERRLEIKFHGSLPYFGKVALLHRGVQIKPNGLKDRPLHQHFSERHIFQASGPVFGQRTLNTLLLSHRDFPCWIEAFDAPKGHSVMGGRVCVARRRNRKLYLLVY